MYSHTTRCSAGKGQHADGPGGRDCRKNRNDSEGLRERGNERGPYVIKKISELLQYRVSKYPAFYYQYFIFVLSIILEPFFASGVSSAS
jgi:hypothetical protein